MKCANRNEAELYIYENNPNGTTQIHLSHIPDRIKTYPIEIAYCSDEWTGRRFGLADVRRNKNPKKIGGGGRNRGSVQAWQLWIWDAE